MGDADLVKPMLEKLGAVHFGRLNMKPGKPTTFATIRRVGTGIEKNVLFFGLPGNPVSCLVTKALFIDPSLRRLQGMDSATAVHAQITVQLESTLALDPERPEYHRAILSTGSDLSGAVTARSTGNQRSSRLLSMSSSNALLCLPQGTGTVTAGTKVIAIVTGPLAAPKASMCHHKSAACLDFPQEAAKASHGVPAPVPASSATQQKAPYKMRVGLLTISDRVRSQNRLPLFCYDSPFIRTTLPLKQASQGVYTDDSGPEMKKMLLAIASGPDTTAKVPSIGWPLEPVIVHTAVVPDEPGTQCCDFKRG
jgi:molybdopterin biosynthesis enzyme MoaB